MFSPRGVMLLAHNHHDEQAFRRHIHANRLAGIPNEWLTPEQAKEFCPILNIDPGIRYPVVGAALQRTGGTARHDAVAWGYARGAPARAASTSSRIARSRRSRATPPARSAASRPRRGPIATKKIGVVAAGHTSVVMAMAGLRMPLESFPLQALVSEPLKPVMPCVVMSNAVHAYMSQSDKGELVIGAGTDGYVSYSQTGGPHIATSTLEAICEMFPITSRLRMLRNWGGIVDTTPDRSPILSKTAGAGACSSIAAGAPAASRRRRDRAMCSRISSRPANRNAIAAPFSIDRFRTGALVNEATAAAVRINEWIRHCERKRSNPALGKDGNPAGEPNSGRELVWTNHPIAYCSSLTMSEGINTLEACKTCC